MGPTKAIVKANTLYEAASGKLIKDGFASSLLSGDYVKHHDLAGPCGTGYNAWQSVAA